MIVAWISRWDAGGNHPPLRNVWYGWNWDEPVQYSLQRIWRWLVSVWRWNTPHYTYHHAEVSVYRVHWRDWSIAWWNPKAAHEKALAIAERIKRLPYADRCLPWDDHEEVTARNDVELNRLPFP